MNQPFVVNVSAFRCSGLGGAFGACVFVAWETGLGSGNILFQVWFCWGEVVTLHVEIWKLRTRRKSLTTLFMAS